MVLPKSQRISLVEWWERTRRRIGTFIPTPSQSFSDTSETTSQNSRCLAITSGRCYSSSTDDPRLDPSSTQDPTITSTKVAKATTIGLGRVSSDTGLTCSSGWSVVSLLCAWRSWRLLSSSRLYNGMDTGGKDLGCQCTLLTRRNGSLAFFSASVNSRIAIGRLMCGETSTDPCSSSSTSSIGVDLNFSSS